MSKLINLVGKKFGRLTVVSKAKNRGKNTYWNCICDCGNSPIIEVRGINLIYVPYWEYDNIGEILKF